jgi:hypothetical protein
MLLEIKQEDGGFKITSPWEDKLDVRGGTLQEAFGKTLEALNDLRGVADRRIEIYAVDPLDWSDEDDED